MADAYDHRLITASTEVAPDPGTLPQPIAEVFARWQTLKGDADMAPAAAFRLDELPTSVVPWALLYDVVDGGRDLRYRFFGTYRVAAHGADYTGRLVSELEPRAIGDKILTETRRVIERRRPLHVITEGEIHDEAFVYNFLRLPLAGPEEDVARVFAVSFEGTGPEEESRLRHYWSRMPRLTER